MEINKLYQELRKATGYKPETALDPEMFNILELNNIMELLEIETRKEAAKIAGDSKPLKYASIVLKTQKTRPILQKAIIRDNLQCFTDSFILFELKKHITGLEVHTDENMIKNYPSFERLHPETNFIIKMSLNDLINDISVLKDDESILLKNDIDFKIKLKVKYIKIMYNVMQFKKDDIIEFNINTLNYGDCYVRPLVIKNDIGSCLLLPLRIIDNE